MQSQPTIRQAGYAGIRIGYCIEARAFHTPADIAGHAITVASRQMAAFSRQASHSRSHARHYASFRRRQSCISRLPPRDYISRRRSCDIELMPDVLRQLADLALYARRPSHFT